MRSRGTLATCGRVAMGAIGFALVVAAGQARAATNLVPGKIAIIKPGKLAKGIFKPTAPATFPLDGDPTAGFASLQVLDTGGGAGSVEYALPAAGWKALGNPAGSKGYKYKGAGSTTDPCKVVLVKEKIVKFVCKGDGVTLAPPVTGQLGAILQTIPGSNYCASFGGVEVKNDATLTKRKEAPSPSACPGTPECGDGVQQLGEQCDDNNVTAGDGCNELCEAETLPCAGGVIGERLVTVTLNVPDIPGASAGIATARVTIGYPEVLTGIPGFGDSSLVLSRISGTPNGTILVNDQDDPLTVSFIGLPPNVIPENASTQFVVADFDSCVDISRNFCSRNQQVIDCCNDPGDPMQAGCLNSPPLCPAGQFPPPGANPGPCMAVNGACPTEDFCVEQLPTMSCLVSETADADGTPVEGVTCTIDVVETIVGPTTTTSTSSTSTSSTTSTTL